MHPWEGFELGRVILAFSAVMYAGIWIQVALFHRAGAFKHWAMYVPVIFTPLIIGAALAGVVQRHGVWGWVAVGALAFGVLDGLAGLYYHLRGVRSQIGGFTVRNFLSGPPPILPVAYSLTGLLGMLGLFWNASAEGLRIELLRLLAV
jgi:hypothetical protein